MEAVAIKTVIRLLLSLGANAAEHDDLALLDDGVVLHDGFPVGVDRGGKVA